MSTFFSARCSLLSFPFLRRRYLCSRTIRIRLALLSVFSPSFPPLAEKSFLFPPLPFYRCFSRPRAVVHNNFSFPFFFRPTARSQSKLVCFPFLSFRGLYVDQLKRQATRGLRGGPLWQEVLFPPLFFPRLKITSTRDFECPPPLFFFLNHEKGFFFFPLFLSPFHIIKVKIDLSYASELTSSPSSSFRG